MRNFLISAVVDIILIFAFYYLFRAMIPKPTRNKLYEKYISSFAKFVIYLFVVTLIIIGVSTLILYRTRYVNYLNVISSALVSIFVGFVISLVPTTGAGDKKEEK
ncbi:MULTISPECIES: hypothetical protein [Clostridium]|uniref:Probable membrane protein n=1 Tax=Clostridium novyi (strain NT) TaxID=386415 RepID=A0PXK2_CLONN|nr:MULTISPECIES: hypothetical protein [Clostridium]ABK60885.1 probable membrane protein [Clostridium novyi NT]KEH87162.1 membrane protein [Clostridium novyi A str. NCTC 538]KEH89859.1 membrane protein [Clostridium novyi A str. 4540]KEH90007.1 membrane protein [Clostridium novyi A str. BKT29909]KEH94415.1 membrane protein [Clostridium novyi A str. GD211209]